MALRISFGECVLHAAIIAVPVVVLLFLGLQRLAPSGVFTVSAGTLERSPYINRILPQERAPQSEAGDYVSLIADPAYMAVHLPAEDFATAEIALTYRNHGQSVFELGALTDIFSQSYDLKPIASTLLDESAWSSLREGERLLLQRNKEYQSIAEFLTNPPSRSRIATYHDELGTPYRETNYQPLGGRQTFDVSLRGYHKIVTYIKNETLSFSLSYMDMNRTFGSDDGVIRVWNENNEVVYERNFADDRNTTENQMSSALTTIDIIGEGWAEGVYSIELSGTSDIFWRRISTTQRYVTLLNRLYIGDDVGYLATDRQTKFYSDAKHCTFETFHADSSAWVSLGSDTVLLPNSHEKVSHDITALGLIEGRTQAGDIRMTCEGSFAFSSGSFFNPYPTRLTANTDLTARGIDFILATYSPPVINEDGWSTAEASFELADLAKQNGAATFVLSAPDIALHGASIDIRDVSVTFTRDPLTLRAAAGKIWHAVTPW